MKNIYMGDLEHEMPVNESFFTGKIKNSSAWTKKKKRHVLVECYVAHGKVFGLQLFPKNCASGSLGKGIIFQISLVPKLT